MNAELSQLRSPGMRKGTSKRSQRYPTTCMRVLSESAYPGTIHVYTLRFFCKKLFYKKLGSDYQNLLHSDTVITYETEPGSKSGFL